MRYTDTDILPLFRGGQIVGLNPNIRIYRYKPGQFFDAHCKCPIHFI